MAVLGLLKEYDLHGYQLKKRLTDLLGSFSVSFGSLYPALARLEAAGALTTVEIDGPQEEPGVTIPMTGSLGGEVAAFLARRGRRSGGGGTTGRGARAKKVYRITEQGQRLFEELLTHEAQGRTGDDRSFTVRLTFARHLPPAGRVRLLRARRDHLAERLAGLRRSLDLVHDPADPYTRALLQHGREAAEHEITWLDRMIAAERVHQEHVLPGEPTTEAHP